MLENPGVQVYEADVETGEGRRTVVFHKATYVDEDGKVAGLVGVILDITEGRRTEVLLQEAIDALQRSQKELLEIATHDMLTGLLNHRSFIQEFERQLAEQQRLNRGGALIWLDIDNFKNINDTLGHQAGDKLLELVGHVISKKMRRYSIIARPGGDEFAVLIPAAGKEEAMKAATRLANALAAQEPCVAGQMIDVSASIGIALYPEHGSTTQQLLTAADIAMYDAKKSGRSCVSLFDPELFQKQERSA